MERLTYGAITTLILLFGICMLIWPARIAEMSNSEHRRPPPSAATLWSMRIVGLAVAWLGAYALYAIVTRLRGAPFLPA